MKVTKLLLTVVLFPSVGFTQIQEGESYDGSWNVAVSVPDARGYTVKLEIAGVAGSYQASVKNRADPCSGYKAPISVLKTTSSEISFRIRLSEIVEGCKDSTVRLIKADDGTLRGARGKHELVAVRSDARSSGAAPRTGPPPSIAIVHMGGSDCPPCKVWRALELPKLQKTPEFAGVQFIYVEKTVESAVPPRYFLADNAKPFKDKLDAASGGMSGSPQVAVFVNNEVFDYYWGARSAAEMVTMIQAISSGTAYPFDRCLKRRDRSHCAEPAAR